MRPRGGSALAVEQHAGAGELLVVDRLDAADLGVDAEPVDHRPAPRLAQAEAQLIVAQQLDDRVGKRVRVARRNEAAVDAIGHDLGNAADRARDHRHAAGHRLEERDALRLPQWTAAPPA